MKLFSWLTPPAFLLVAILSACSGAQNPATETQSITPPVAEAVETATEISADTPVAVTWKLCVPEGTFPGDTYPSNTDAAGCRHNENRVITVWPMEDGSVEVYYVRNKRSPAVSRSATRVSYQLATKSRGCSPDGPESEGFYEAGEVTSIEIEWADDRKFIPIEDVALTTATMPDESNDTIAGFLFLQGGCDEIDPERVF